MFTRKHAYQRGREGGVKNGMRRKQGYDERLATPVKTKDQRLPQNVRENLQIQAKFFTVAKVGNNACTLVPTISENGI